MRGAKTLVLVAAGMLALRWIYTHWISSEPPQKDLVVEGNVVILSGVYQPNGDIVAKGAVVKVSGAKAPNGSIIAMAIGNDVSDEKIEALRRLKGTNI